jgi:hypothetical protein
VRNLLIRILVNETVVVDGLNLQHASVGLKTNLPKLRQVVLDACRYQSRGCCL